MNAVKSSIRFAGLVLLSAPLVGCEASDDTPPEPAAAPAGLHVEVTVRLERGTYADATIRFHNPTTLSVWIVRPVGTADLLRYFPVYQLDVVGPDGACARASGGRCGTIDPTDRVWPQDYLAEIRPGEALTVKGWDAFALDAAGKYRVRFTYEYQPRPVDPPTQAWCGRLTAPEVVVDYEPEPEPPQHDAGGEQE